MFTFANWKLWAILALAALAAFQQVRVSGAQADAAEARSALSADRARYASDALARGEEERKIEAARLTENERIAREAQERIKVAEGDARRAAAAADRLRDQVAALLRAKRPTGPSAGAVVSSPPAPAADDLLAGVLDRHSRELVEVGRFADAAHLAGLACERSFDALANEVRP